MKKDHEFVVRRLSAVSLLELLVVVAVVAVVFCLVFPLYQTVQQRAKGAACLANLRTYGAGLLTFSADNSGLPWWDGKRPDQQSPGSTYPNFEYFVRPYVHQVFAKRLRCPLATASDKANIGQRFNYTGNANLCSYYPRLNGLPVESSRVVLAAEIYSYEAFWHTVHLNMTMWGLSEAEANAVPSSFPGASEGRKAQYHGSKTNRSLNLFFLDGHVAAVFPEKGDWRVKPTYGSGANGGYFYNGSQFSLMRTE